MTQSEVTKAKADLRRKIRESRKAKQEGHFCEDQHDEHLVMFLADNNVRKIAAYIALDDEPCTDLLLDVCEQVGIQVLVPRVVNEDLEWAIFNWDDLTEGEFGILEPVGPAEPLQVDAILVPALAVDAAGNRLGKGRGFYDRALAKVDRRVPIIALVHDEEVFEEIPHEGHDLKVDYVACCTGVHKLD
ncbi:MAG: 5-formyltetrahydrofolate cyclo-ligase [Micrococcales bacterium]